VTATEGCRSRNPVAVKQFGRAASGQDSCRRIQSADDIALTVQVAPDVFSSVD
jgi:hypothetical protein